MPSIILSDNGVSSGSAGIKTSGSNDGTLALQTTTAAGTATTAVSIDTSQNVSFVNAANLPNTFGFKNRIINGAMVIDQRNAGAAVALSGGNFPVDRMRLSSTGTIATATVQQNLNSITPPTGFQNYIGMSVTSGLTTPSNGAGRITQRVEGYSVSDFGFGAAGASTVTLSFWVRASSTGTFGGSLQNSANDRGYVFSYTISAANTWEYKTVTIAGDTSGTWLKTNGIGILVLFSVGAGSTFQGAAGSWSSTVVDTVTGQVDLLATTGATFYITGVQLEKGSAATSFDYRPYGAELALCQRYYYRYKATGSADYFGSGSVFSSTQAMIVMPFPVPMRTNPTALEQNGQPNHYRLLSSSGSGISCNVVPAFNTSSPFMASVEFGVASGITGGNGTVAFSGNSAAYLGFSAEL